MRYIRTKDGIEQASYSEDFREGKSYFYKTKCQWVYGDVYHKVKVKTYAKNGTTKIADTIEELCDEFVVYDIHKNKYLNFIHLKSLIGYCEENGLDKTTIKGAIWCKFGLKYVAKMNEEGELELI